MENVTRLRSEVVLGSSSVCNKHYTAFISAGIWIIANVECTGVFHSVSNLRKKMINVCYLSWHTLHCVFSPP